jgi:hypothetical protein
MEVIQGPYKTIGFQQLATLTASTGLTVPVGARCAYIQCEAQAVRMRGDGTAPTAAIGLRLTTTAAPFFYQGDLASLRFIEEVAGGKINCEFLG